MNRRHCRQILLLLVTLGASGSLALLSGCKGNTSAAAIIERKVTPPPAVQAYQTHSDLRTADPLSSSEWISAHWTSFTAPLNTDQTTAPAEGAILYSDSTLYVAFVCAKPTAPFAKDSVSVFLDSSSFHNGSELLRVTVNATGQTNCTWIRDAAPPTHPLDDGSPDVVHPISKIPADTLVSGLSTHLGAGVWNDAPAWTAVVAIPVRNLPMPLRTSPTPGTHWKVNLLRTTMVGDGNSFEQLQANLSPVYVGQQPVSPYRLADLYLAPAEISSTR